MLEKFLMLRGLAKNGTNGGGASGETLVAEETVLASGTIAGDFKGGFDTGITMSDLKNWHTFIIRIHDIASGNTIGFYEDAIFDGTDAKTYWPMRIFNMTSASTDLKHIIGVFEWADTEKTFLKPVALGGTSRGQWGGAVVNPRIVTADMYSSYWKTATIFRYYQACFEGNLFIYVGNANTDNDITWEIRGMIK